MNREQVTNVLTRAGMAPEDIGTLLDGLIFPDRASHLAKRLGHVGITAERLMDRLGASP